MVAASPVRNLDCAAIPANTGLGEAAAERFVVIPLLCLACTNGSSTAQSCGRFSACYFESSNFSVAKSKLPDSAKVTLR
jgi:hypothetical protein